MELSYSCHLGTDRNKSKRGSRAAKNSISGTSSLSNHSIQNMNQLGHVLKHDLRLEEYNNENIVMVIGVLPALALASEESNTDEDQAEVTFEEVSEAETKSENLAVKVPSSDSKTIIAFIKMLYENSSADSF